MTFRSILQALKLWAIWNLVTDIGMTLSLVAGFVFFAYLGIREVFYQISAFIVFGSISGLMGGALVGLFQWLVLRNKIKNAGRWILATALGWMAGITILVVSVFWYELGDTVSIFFTAAIVGGVVGFAQFCVLKNETSDAGLWVPTNIVGWIVAILLARGIANTGLHFEGGITEVVAGLIVIGMITGVGFVFLFDQTSERRFNLKMSAGLTLAIIFGVGLFTSQVFSQSKFTLHGHDYQVYAVTYSPDGSILASGSYDNTVKLWDVSTGKEIRTLGKNEADYYKAVQYISFSPDGKLLAALLEDDTIRLWNIASGQEVDILENNEDFYSLKFSPDGRLAVAGGNKIIFWDTSSGKAESWTGRSGISMDFSPDGRFIASAFQNNVTILDVNAKEEIAFLDGDGSSIYSVAFTPDGKFVASGGHLSSDARPDQRALILWDMSSGKRIKAFGDNSMSVESIDISPDGTLLAVGLFGSSVIRLYNLDSGEEVAVLRGHSDSVNSVAFSPDGTYLASGSYDDTVRLWDLTKIK